MTSVRSSSVPPGFVPLRTIGEFIAVNVASFCDMLLPLTAHRRVREIAQRFLPTISLQMRPGPASLCRFGLTVQGSRAS
jgi:hypothetical protein